MEGANEHRPYTRSINPRRGQSRYERLIQEVLAATRDNPFVRMVKNLSDGLERLSERGYDRRSVPARRPGIETVNKLLLAAPRVPILVLTALDDQGIASQAVQHEAQIISRGVTSTATHCRGFCPHDLPQDSRRRPVRRRDMPKSRLTRLVTQFSVRTVRAR